MLYVLEFYFCYRLIQLFITENTDQLLFVNSIEVTMVQDKAIGSFYKRKRNATSAEVFEPEPLALALSDNG
jgi:hypothetical protein